MKYDMLKFFSCLIILWHADAFQLIRRGPMAASGVTALAMNNRSTSEITKQIYNIPNSGWASPSWNWGYASGTGHDCAAICRKLYASRDERERLVSSLLEPVEFKSLHQEVSFEEVKLVLGLAWQNGRWDGSDGGPNGYGEVLQTMAMAIRYENEDDVISAINFIQDVSDKFSTISKSEGKLNRMKDMANACKGGHSSIINPDEVFKNRRICAGLVLDAMGFVENGL